LRLFNTGGSVRHHQGPSQLASPGTTWSRTAETVPASGPETSPRIHEANRGARAFGELSCCRRRSPAEDRPVGRERGRGPARDLPGGQLRHRGSGCRPATAALLHSSPSWPQPVSRRTLSSSQCAIAVRKKSRKSL
jgi:hypothetical protein